MLLIGYKPGSALYKLAHYVIAKSDLENLLCLSVPIPFCLVMIGRVVRGACPPGADTWIEIFCNAEAASNALPQDLVLLAYLIPVGVSVTFKGVRKESIFTALLMTSSVVFGCIAYLRAWNQIWSMIIPTVKTFMVAYELERGKIEFFIQSRKALLEERGKRRQAEAERREQERARAELEAREALLRTKRLNALMTLPVHTALIKHAELRVALGSCSSSSSASDASTAELHRSESKLDGGQAISRRGARCNSDENEASVAEVLGAIDNHLDTLVQKDFDGRTAFELALSLEESDPRLATQILLRCLPVDAATGRPVPAAAHGFAWHRAVQVRTSRARSTRIVHAAETHSTAV